MKTFHLNTLLAASILGLSTLTWFGCAKKEETKPTVTVPTLSATTAATSITQTSASSGGNVTSDGGSTILARGVCYDTTASPTFDNNHKFTSDGTGTGAFTSTLTNMVPGKMYFARAYATNAQGVAYGAEISFTTLAPTVIINDPTLVTGSATNILVNGATCGGAVADNGGSGQTITAKGIQYSTSNSIAESDPKIPGIGPESGFTSNLTGLLTNTQYFYRAYATNSGGKTGYGSIQSFTTSSNPPASLTTATVTDVYLLGNAALYQAKATGNISNLNGGVLVKKGFVWSTTNNNPTLSSRDGQQELTDGAIGNFVITLTGLPKLKTVYIRAFTTTSFSGPEVTGYGTTKSIETFVKDIDDNLYNMVKIGNYVWMKENLKTTRFNDGGAITKLNDNALWAAANTSSAYCEPANDPSKVATYGLLYNHNVVATSKVCPVGWVVPTRCCNQIDDLWNAVGGMAVAGKNLKAVSSLWNPALSAGDTDPQGFSALPAAQREPDGNFVWNLGRIASFWLLEDGPATGGGEGWHWTTNESTSSSVYASKISPKYGMSVRCMK